MQNSLISRDLRLVGYNEGVALGFPVAPLQAEDRNPPPDRALSESEPLRVSRSESSTSRRNGVRRPGRRKLRPSHPDHPTSRGITDPTSVNPRDRKSGVEGK